jgi:ATP synthase protein I
MPASSPSTPRSDDDRPPDDDAVGDPFSPSNDTRVEIPKLLRTPVEHPASMQAADKAAEEMGSTTLAGAGRAWSIAFDFVVTTIAGLGLGWLFDRWRGTTPWGILVGLGLGLVLAFFRIVRSARQSMEEDDKRRR